MRWSILLFSLGCLFSLGGIVQGQTSTAVYQSPREVFFAAQKAVEKENWSVFCNAMTPESVDTLSGMMVVLGGAVKKALDKLDKYPKIRAKFEEKVAPMMAVLAKHKVPEGILAQAGEAAQSLQQLSPQQLKVKLKTFSGPVRDRRSFLGDFLASMRQKGKTTKFDGKLTDVRVSGNSASAVVLRKGEKEPITFKRVGNSWLIDLSDQMLGRMISRKQ